MTVYVVSWQSEFGVPRTAGLYDEPTAAIRFAEVMSDDELAQWVEVWGWRINRPKKEGRSVWRWDRSVAAVG